MSLEPWAQTQIAQILPLDHESVKQIVSYSNSLEPEAAANHLGDILGDSDLARDFINAYKTKRTQSEHASSSVQGTAGQATKPNKQRKGKANFNRLPEVRRPEDYGNTTGAYHKKDESDEYMPASRSRPKSGTASPSTGLSTEPEARQLPKQTTSMGLLDASMPNVHARTSSPANKHPRTSTPSPASTPRNQSPRPTSSKHSTTKVSIAGGTPMHGASSTLSDLESALRTLEMSTNPTLHPPDPAVRRCMCMGSQHPLLAAAPNCLHCGKVVCTKEGLAPCTFCGNPLLTPDQVQEMVRALRDERGREKQAVNNASHQRAQISTMPKPFTAVADGASGVVANGGANGALEKAQAHRDRLLGFQATNAARTKVVDEAAAFETPEVGVSQWGSSVQRAAQLKKQQRVLREMEWNARPDYEKRKMVVSVDLVGGKVVRRMAGVSKAEALGPDEVDENEDDEALDHIQPQSGSGGAFARNPLLGKLIRPTWQPKDGDKDAKGKDVVGDISARASAWRRVQDDQDDNEAIILNGGTFGGQDQELLRSEEPAE